MNMLNSVLLEGNLIDDPRIDPATSKCYFTIDSIREYREKDEIIQKHSCIGVEASGKIGLACAEQLKKSRGVRIVGRLDQHMEDFDGKDISIVVLNVERVEFKLIKKER